MSPLSTMRQVRRAPTAAALVVHGLRVARGASGVGGRNMQWLLMLGDGGIRPFDQHADLPCKAIVRIVHDGSDFGLGFRPVERIEQLAQARLQLFGLGAGFLACLRRIPHRNAIEGQHGLVNGRS
ncbi:hypothetical protein ACETIH_07525 [Microvirga arabica]|uniref:PilZ domain-containing protein n=1 Tax=Microvirga arabica TaxID=1128671 RepID=A0ABV6Y5M1_9HYPH